jgi:hypothetical protein
MPLNSTPDVRFDRVPDGFHAVKSQKKKKKGSDQKAVWFRQTVKFGNI